MSEIPFTPLSQSGTRFSPRRRSPWSRRAIRAFAVLLIVAGSLALIDAGVTLVWQEPFSAIYAKLRQDHLSGALAKVEEAAPTAEEKRRLVDLADVRRRVAYLAGRLQGRAKDGSPVGRIHIPRIGANFVVVKGTDTSDLESGPGIYSETVFPGMAGTTAIAGHRTTYLAPFRHVDLLRRGSTILLNMPYAHFTYKVVGKRVVQPTNVEAAVGNVGYSRLVLSACTPLFSAAKRLLIYARLVRTVPMGAGRVPLSQRPPGAQEALVGDQLEQPAVARRSLAKKPTKPSLPAVLESSKAHLIPPLAEQ
ncbi:MAG TPA: class E sortase [Solirubrobacteraceae bacterium]|jgi:sortase A|nr:class E sortase [Solirubrobacteraceae bacterium]